MKIRMTRKRKAALLENLKKARAANRKRFRKMALQKMAAIVATNSINNNRPFLIIVEGEDFTLLDANFNRVPFKVVNL